MTVEPLNDAAIIERLEKLNSWQRDGDRISKTFELANYTAGLAFATAVGTIAEGFDHHPDMHIGYKKVTVSFTTHSAGSKITEKDFQVAEAIEQLPYP